MESNGPGALVAAPPPQHQHHLPLDPLSLLPQSRTPPPQIQLQQSQPQSLLPSLNLQSPPADPVTAASLLDTPVNRSYASHLEPSNVRGSYDPPPGPVPAPSLLPNAIPAVPQAPDSPSRTNAVSVANLEDPFVAPPESLSSSYGYDSNAWPTVSSSDHLAASSTIGVDGSMGKPAGWEPAGNNYSAHAVLQFNDSNFYINIPYLILGRDQKFHRKVKEENRERKRLAKTQQALALYDLEPSQPSIPGDDDERDNPITATEALVGRIPRGLISNYSEQGGVVGYPSDEDDEVAMSRPKRRGPRAKANSSSANSIAPQSLHPIDHEYVQGKFHDIHDGQWCMIPIHPARSEDISKISREHLLIYYKDRWVMRVIGNGAFLNETHYPKDPDVEIPLSNEDEILVATISMRLLLPHGGDDHGDDDATSATGDIVESVELDSPTTGRTAAATDAGSSDEDQDDEPARERPKIKLKIKSNRAQASGGKTTENQGGKHKDRETPAEQSPEAARKSEKGKKPKAAAPETSDNVKEERTSPPPAAPVNIDQNSLLADLRPEELPEKRKGPGRPPKNGFVSKRDEALVKKKKKDLEKAGQEEPDFNTLLAMVRQEQKAKDAANKAMARGDAPPAQTVPSIEGIPKSEVVGNPSQTPTAPIDPAANAAASAETRSSPKPRRAARSPSPIPPETAFSEEQLKKPTQTYIYVIDEILQNIEGGQADLQTIYDKIQKRWPYFKYRAPSVGWQSSVRHNLLSSERFKDAGKSGKGKYWTINFDFSLDNKKKKPTPPPRPMPMPMANGQPMHNMPPGQYGPQQYSSPYGPPTANGQMPYVSGAPAGSYYSPYAPPNAGGAYPNAHPNAAPMAPMRNASTPMRGASHQPHGQNSNHGTPQPSRASQQPAPPPPQQAVPFQPVVDAIMNYRKQFLGQFVSNETEYKKWEDIFIRGTGYFSNLFHGQPITEITGFDMNTEPFSGLREIFEQFSHLIPKPGTDAGNGAGASGAEAAGSGASNGQINGAVTTNGAPESSVASSVVASDVQPSVAAHAGGALLNTPNQSAGNTTVQQPPPSLSGPQAVSIPSASSVTKDPHPAATGPVANTLSTASTSNSLPPPFPPNVYAASSPNGTTLVSQPPAAPAEPASQSSTHPGPNRAAQVRTNSPSAPVPSSTTSTHPATHPSAPSTSSAPPPHQNPPNNVTAGQPVPQAASGTAMQASTAHAARPAEPALSTLAGTKRPLESVGGPKRVTAGADEDGPLDAKRMKLTS